MQLINGIAYGWSEIVFGLDGITFSAIKAITYRDKIDRGKLRGTGMRVLAKTSGEHDAEAEFEIAEEEYRTLIRLLGDGYMRKLINVSVSYSNDDGTGTVASPAVHTDTFAARMASDEHAHTQGTDPLTIKIGLDVFGPIFRDGVDPLGASTL